MGTKMGILGKGAGVCGLLISGVIAGQMTTPLLAEGPAKKGAVANAATPTAADADKNVVAYVNGQPITRQELGEVLVARKGKEQLRFLINKKIIDQACAKAGIQVTDEEVEENLRSQLKSLSMDRKVFEESVLKERNSSLYEYKEDAIRPDIAMRKLAQSRVKVTDEDVRKLFETKYGEKVKCRVILIPGKNFGQASQIHSEVKADRTAFLKRAREQAAPHLAAKEGEFAVPRHFFLHEVEKEAFKIRDGEVSKVIETNEGHVILLRESLEPANKKIQLAEARPELEKQLMNQKLEVEIKKVFKELKDQAMVRDYLNNEFNDAGTQLIRKTQTAKQPPTSANTEPARRKMP